MAPFLPKADPPVLVGSCLHRFHGGCIQKWVTRNPTCPVCRGPAKPDQIQAVEVMSIGEQLALTLSDQLSELCVGGGASSWRHWLLSTLQHYSVVPFTRSILRLVAVQTSKGFRPLCESFVESVFWELGKRHLPYLTCCNTGGGGDAAVLPRDVLGILERLGVGVSLSQLHSLLSALMTLAQVVRLDTGPPPSQRLEAFAVLYGALDNCMRPGSGREASPAGGRQRRPLKGILSSASGNDDVESLRKAFDGAPLIFAGTASTASTFHTDSSVSGGGGANRLCLSANVFWDGEPSIAYLLNRALLRPAFPSLRAFFVERLQVPSIGLAACTQCLTELARPEILFQRAPTSTLTSAAGTVYREMQRQLVNATAILDPGDETDREIVSESLGGLRLLCHSGPLAKVFANHHHRGSPVDMWASLALVSTDSHLCICPPAPELDDEEEGDESHFGVNRQSVAMLGDWREFLATALGHPTHPAAPIMLAQSWPIRVVDSHSLCGIAPALRAAALKHGKAFRVDQIVSKVGEGVVLRGQEDAPLWDGWVKDYFRLRFIEEYVDTSAVGGSFFSRAMTGQGAPLSSGEIDTGHGSAEEMITKLQHAERITCSLASSHELRMSRRAKFEELLEKLHVSSCTSMWCDLQMLPDPAIFDGHAGHRKAAHKILEMRASNVPGVQRWALKGHSWACGSWLRGARFNSGVSNRLDDEVNWLGCSLRHRTLLGTEARPSLCVRPSVRRVPASISLSPSEVDFLDGFSSPGGWSDAPVGLRQCDWSEETLSSLAAGICEFEGALRLSFGQKPRSSSSVAAEVAAARTYLRERIAEYRREDEDEDETPEEEQEEESIATSASVDESESLLSPTDTDSSEQAWKDAAEALAAAGGDHSRDGGDAGWEDGGEDRDGRGLGPLTSDMLQAAISFSVPPWQLPRGPAGAGDNGGGSSTGDNSASSNSGGARSDGNDQSRGPNSPANDILGPVSPYSPMGGDIKPRLSPAALEAAAFGYLEHFLPHFGRENWVTR